MIFGFLKAKRVPRLPLHAAFQPRFPANREEGIVMRRAILTCLKCIQITSRRTRQLQLLRTLYCSPGEMPHYLLRKLPALINSDCSVDDLFDHVQYCAGFVSRI